MKKIAYVDPTKPGIVRFYGADEFDGVLAGTRAQMIVDALNATQPAEVEAMRVLTKDDSYCPSCGHDRDSSSVSSIDHDEGIKSCQMCAVRWRELDSVL